MEKCEKFFEDEKKMSLYRVPRYVWCNLESVLSLQSLPTRET